MYSNIFWVIIFIISKHYVAGGFLTPVKKKAQCTYDEKREDIENTETKFMHDFEGLFCKDGEPYRSIDGTCNNKKCPGLGAKGTPYQRFWKNSYCDGKEELTCSCTNDSLTSARVISQKLYKPKKKLDCNTILTIGFGQFVVHDLARALIGARVTCCDNGKYTCDQETHPKCAAIDIPSCDPVYGPADIRCLNFVRTDTDKCDPLSDVTHYLDVSTLYGSDGVTAKNLRTGCGGKMQSVKRDGKEWPPQSMNPMETCFNLTCSEEPCYKTGDARGNQNSLLTMMHIIFLRFHNDCADKICGKKKCPWDDEKCYQEVRRIVIAVYQHITYNEYLPLVMGRDYMYKHKIIYKKSCRDKYGYINDYSCDCDPSMSVECSTAALREQHSAIPGFFKLYCENEEYCKNKSRCDDDYFDVSGSIELSAWMNKPSVIEKGDNSEGLSRGLFAQCQECVDTHMDYQVQNLMFRADRPLGFDLAALDIQRGRDHGVPKFCTVALKCGIISKCDCFDDLKDIIPEKYLCKLDKLYNGNVGDVELMVGGMVEPLVPGTLIGSVFRCILGKQFRYTRCGDAFWYESGDQVYPFTPEQLCNIRQIKMSYLICLYGDGIDKIQKHAFKKICKKNPMINCCDLPSLDYSLFQTY